MQLNLALATLSLLLVIFVSGVYGAGAGSFCAMAAFAAALAASLEEHNDED